VNQRKKYSLTYYEGIDSEGYRKKKEISVGIRKRLKYDMTNRSGMEGRKKNTLGTAKKVLIAPRLGRTL